MHLFSFIYFYGNLKDLKDVEDAKDLGPRKDELAAVRILSTEGRGDSLCWALSKANGPIGKDSIFLF